uniref:Xanthine dehydrogenase n=1 Tax=Xiphophorus couchianus TaxID=32473 RepID=A0A3B5M2R5_9TELE
ELLQEACSSLAEEMSLDPSAPGGMVRYRQTLTLSLFYKFYLTTNTSNVQECNSLLDLQAVPEGQNQDDMVGCPIMHLSALKQATGEAVYCDDVPLYENELYLALITSTKAHARILSVDVSVAERCPGVVCCLFASDVPGSNTDQSAAKAVRIQYEELKPIVTIQVRPEPPGRSVITVELTEPHFSDHILEGEIHMGGQEHFYLETNVTLAVPREEDGEMELFISSQSPSDSQSFVAKALGVPANRVLVRVKRMGGGFGGKESRTTVLSTVVAVAANRKSVQHHVHLNCVQVASRVLGIPCSKVFISETSTNTVANTSPTAASASTDLNGAAVQNACEILLKRLEPFKTKNPKGSWEDWVRRTRKTPDLGYDFDTNSGRAFNYYSYGVACSEVEIDCLTGNLRTTIVMDVGHSLNPAIDIGQVEGGFMQGLGLFTLEELHYSPQGVLLTRGPGSYKIPAFGDIPTQLTVSLLRDAPNEKDVLNRLSLYQAVGEPPLFLAASVFYAIKDAVRAARAESQMMGPFRLDSPASAERIRNACCDRFTKLV